MHGKAGADTYVIHCEAAHYIFDDYDSSDIDVIKLETNTLPEQTFLSRVGNDLWVRFRNAGGTVRDDFKIQIPAKFYRHGTIEQVTFANGNTLDITGTNGMVLYTTTDLSLKGTSHGDVLHSHHQLATSMYGYSGPDTYVIHCEAAHYILDDYDSSDIDVIKLETNTLPEQTFLSRVGNDLWVRFRNADGTVRDDFKIQIPSNFYRYGMIEAICFESSQLTV